MSELQPEYKRAIEARIRKAEEYLSSGKCADYVEYKAKCAHISGMREALVIFNDVAKRHGEHEDE